MTQGNPAPANKPEGLCYLQTWVPHTCSSCLVPGSPWPNASRCQGHCCLTTQVHWICCLTSILNSLLNIRSWLIHTQVNLSLQALLFFVARRLLSPQNTEDQHSPLSLTVREHSFPHQRARTPDSPMREGKLKPATLQEAPEARFPQVHRIPVNNAAPPCRRVISLLSKSKNPSSRTEWQSATLTMLGGLEPTVHKDPMFPIATTGEPLCPPQRTGIPSLSLRR
jgi:hypothetical protein